MRTRQVSELRQEGVQEEGCHQAEEGDGYADRVHHVVDQTADVVLEV